MLTCEKIVIGCKHYGGLQQKYDDVCKKGLRSIYLFATKM